MKTILALALIIIGGVVFFRGLNRQDSLVGQASEAGASIANSLDGGTRTPRHIVYMVAGGALVIAGIAVGARRSGTRTP